MNSSVRIYVCNMCETGIPPLGVVALNPDFMAVARAFGAEGMRATGPKELTESIRHAFALNGPTLMEAVEADFLR